MGSFIARLYVLQHPHSMRGVVIHGTGGPNRLAPLGKLVGRMVSFFSGKRSRSMLITALAFGSYNRGFDKSEGRNAWLSRDKDEPAVKDKKNDPLASFMFTTSGYIDLFDMLIRSNSREWFEGYPKDMRTLIVSGDMDPVGGYGRGVKYVYKQLMMQGCSDVMLQLYEGARHELFNETNKEEFFADLLEWLNGVAL
jgi:alpha-beta hydrolase superfamily lysophospholipase